MQKVMICGVDCKPGGEHCNGYCRGVCDAPPDATKTQMIAQARSMAMEKLGEAERAWHAYAALCEVGPERTLAFDTFENIRTAVRRAI